MSERTAARLTRILAMLPWVMANPETASVDEVCRRFGYTAKELARDLDLVMVCGLPGYFPHDLMYASIAGDDVVVEAADYFSGQRRLTASEGLRLLSAALATDAAGAGSPALRSAAAKLSAVLVPDGEGVVVDVTDQPEPVEALQGAVTARRRVRITYRALNRDETTVRELEPWQVFTDIGRWYLDAHDHSAGAYRRFRVDRIRDVEVLGDVFEPPAELPAPEADYQPNPDDVRAVIRLAPAARWVAEYYPMSVLGSGDDGVEVELRSSSPSVPARLLLRLGADAVLVEGEEVAAELERLRAAVLSRYEG